MNKGIVYKIEVGDELYIGSTEQTLCARQSCHNRDLKKFPHRKLYKACIDNGINKIKCWWVADIVFNSFEERRVIEETYRKQLNAELNSVRCYRSQEEKKEYMKQYNIDHKEEKKEEKKQYYLDHKEKIVEYQKQYRLDHKEKLAEKKRLYDIKNRDIINAKARAKRKEKKLLKLKSS
jgi:hypothetical protein